MTGRTRREALAALAGVASLGGCVTESDTDAGPGTEPPHGSPANTPDSPSSGPAGPEPVDLDEPATRWAVEFDGPVTDAPAVAGDTVIAATGTAEIGTPTQDGDGGGTLATLRADDGTTRWVADLPAPAFGSPLVAAGGVYVQTGYSTGMTGAGQRLVKVVDGARRWTTGPTGGFNHLLAVDDDGTAFVGTSDDAISAGGQPLFTVGDDGHRRWTVESGDTFGGRLLEDGLLVDLGGMALEVRAPADGSRRWRTATEALTDPDDEMHVVDGAVPVAHETDEAEAIGLVDLADGAVRWTFSEDHGTPFVPTGATTILELSIGTQHDSLLVATEYDGHVYGLAPLDGGLLWKFKAAEDVRDAPVSDGERVYVGDFGGTVYALDAATGDEVWRSEVGGHGGWLGVAGETVVVDAGKESETLVGLAASDGSTRWTLSTGANLTRPALGDGVVAVGSESGVLRVLGG